MISRENRLHVHFDKGRSEHVVKVIFFGRLGDLIGRETELDPRCEPATIQELREQLAALHPHAAAELLSGSLRACVGDSVVPDEHRIGRGATVEFFPPLSGG
jgi:molybdopterin converting factor small subunit